MYDVVVRAASASVIYGSRMLYGEASEVKRVSGREDFEIITIVITVWISPPRFTSKRTATRSRRN